MDHTNWLRQTDKPLFPDIIWSRPETKQGAGKLLIIGGNSHGFGAPGIAYKHAYEAGAGVCRVLLPDAVKKVVKYMLPDADYAPSTPSGSFAKNALSDFLTLSDWSDAVLVAGDIGRNSETAMLLESYVEKNRNLLVITKDALDYFLETPLQIVDREKTVVIASLQQLQKIFISTPSITPITYGMSTPQLVEALQSYTLKHPACIVVKHNDFVFVAINGQVSTTRHDSKVWRVEIASKVAVFGMHTPTNLFEALSTAVYNNAENEDIP